MHRSGTVLAGRYRIVRHVGSGGMGTVHLAHDQVLDREVAVKSVHAEPESELGRRIVREARLGAGLRHPHLVTVFDVLPEGGTLLLVTEYVEGETLADALRRGPLEATRALQVLRAVAAALDHAHARGIVHRDVKPANVLLGARGAVKLADLGIATAADATRITKTGGALGTVAYMAPEQFEPGPATAAVDVYALAAVAYEALAGRQAYPGSAAFAVFERLREGAPPPDVREHRPELPQAVSGVLRRGMAAEPEERPASAGELVAELERALAGESAPLAAPARDAGPVAAPPDEAGATARRSRHRRRRTVVFPLALLATLGLVGAIVALSVGGGGDDEPARSDRARTDPAATVSRAQPTPPTVRGPQTPVDAVRRFYTGLAEGDVGAAWRIAGPRFRREYGGSRAAFEDDFASLRGIRFERLEEQDATARAATVALETVAEHTDRTDRCSGTVQTVLLDGRWRVEPYGVSCNSAG
jgi:eukaryotic-like serine/threonine-protein kinase